MLKSRDAEFKVTTLEEDISLDFQSRLHFVERVEAIQIPNDDSTLILKLTSSEGHRPSFHAAFDRHTLVQGLKVLLREIDPSTDDLILKELREFNKTLRKSK